MAGALRASWGPKKSLMSSQRPRAQSSFDWPYRTTGAVAILIETLVAVDDTLVVRGSLLAHLQAAPELEGLRQEIDPDPMGAELVADLLCEAAVVVEALDEDLAGVVVGGLHGRRRIHGRRGEIVQSKEDIGEHILPTLALEIDGHAGLTEPFGDLPAEADGRAGVVVLPTEDAEAGFIGPRGDLHGLAQLDIRDRFGLPRRRRGRARPGEWTSRNSTSRMPTRSRNSSAWRRATSFRDGRLRLAAEVAAEAIALGGEAQGCDIDEAAALDRRDGRIREREPGGEVLD